METKVQLKRKAVSTVNTVITYEYCACSCIDVCNNTCKENGGTTLILDLSYKDPYNFAADYGTPN